MGSTAAGTSINGSSYLQLHGGGKAVGAEPLVLNSSYRNWGTLYSTSGTNSWAGDITLQSSAWIGVGTTDGLLDLTGAIQGSGSLTVVNKGTVRMSGSSTNTYTGETHVNSGTLVLARTVANNTILGDLFIGDAIGLPDDDVLRLDRGAQIADVHVIVADSGLFDLNGWSECVGSLSGSGRVTMGNGILSTGGDGSSTIYSGLIEGTGILRKYGTGTFTLTADNPFSGTSEIISGTLLVNGSQPANTVSVGASGRLGGTGTVGDVQSDGEVAPGASPGKLAAGNATLQSGSSFAVELNGFTVGTAYDQLDVRGLVHLDNASLDVALNCPAAVGDQFLILDNDGADAISDTFAGLLDGASLTAGNATLEVDYHGGTGNDVVLTVTRVVPTEELRITSIEAVGDDAELNWVGGVPFYVVEKKTALTNAAWLPVTAPMRGTQTNVPMDASAGFYRVSGGN